MSKQSSVIETSDSNWDGRNKPMFFQLSFDEANSVSFDAEDHHQQAINVLLSNDESGSTRLVPVWYYQNDSLTKRQRRPALVQE